MFPHQNGMMEGISRPEFRAIAQDCCEQAFTAVAGIPRVEMLVLDAAGAVSTQMVAADSGSTFTAATAEFVYNRRPRSSGPIKVCGGYTELTEGGEIIHPHHLTGLVVTTGFVAPESHLPHGCVATLGCDGIDHSSIDVLAQYREQQRLDKRSLPPIRRGSAMKGPANYRASGEGDHAVFWDGDINFLLRTPMTHVQFQEGGTFGLARLERLLPLPKKRTKKRVSFSDTVSFTLSRSSPKLSVRKTTTRSWLP